MKKIFVFSAILVFGILSLGHARIINIPADYSTIQAGIDASVNGDTVLVQPGTYIENINFDGHNITLCSRFLIDSDTASIDSTIIDGDRAGVTVKFINGEDNAAIVGFTIVNGQSGNAGGILCYHSSPDIKWNKIWNNYSSVWYAGGGIFCDSLSNAIISYNRIYRNYSSLNGGGIGCNYANPTITHNIIYRNTAYQ